MIDGYVRVSRVAGRTGASFISPVLQREQIEGWCGLHGYDVGVIHEELDESGGRADRPKLQRAIERVEAGESEGLVVAKLDRFGRSLLDSLTAIERIQRAGGRFASVADGFDLGTETGRLVVRIMLSLAEFELERYRSQFALARQRAVARGVHPSPVPPVGYRRRSDGVLGSDPSGGPIIRELFERASAGAAWAELARWLESEGLSTAYGNPRWTGRAVKEVVRNRVYLGEARHGEFVKRGAHPKLTDELTFVRAQRPGRLTGVRRHAPALLTGLIRCAGCRHAMQPEWRRGCHRYKCRRIYPGGECGAPAHISDSQGALHEYVEAAFFGKLGELVMAPTASSEESVQLELAAAEARGAYEMWRDLSASDLVRLEKSEYALALSRRHAAARDAEAAVLAEAERTMPPFPFGPVRIDEVWPTLSILERRELLAQMIDVIFVRPSVGIRGAPGIAERIHICWRGEAPADMPSRARSGPLAVVVEPFLFPRR
jgi:site-specific DNA recombinase